MKFFLEAYNYAKSSIWRDEVSDSYIAQLSQEVFDNLKQNCTKNHIFLRLTGQSGSGKTSQLCAATSTVCEEKGLRPLHLAVRNFAKYFPNAKLLNETDYREKTNGFALKMLICVLELAFNEGVDIMLEIAILSKKFEKYIKNRIKIKKYKVFLQIMCVNKILSSAFILKRRKNIKRITSLKSENYFYFTMKKTLNYIIKNNDCKCAVWSAYDLSPIYFGPAKFIKKCYKINEKRVEKLKFDENELLQAKINFLRAIFLDDLL